MVTKKLETWPSFSSFLFLWMLNTVPVWAAVVILAMIFAGSLLHRSLVPAPVLFALAVAPIVTCTGLIQGLLYLAAKRLRPESPKFCNLLMLAGTTPVSVCGLWLMTLLVGGADFFIPRL
jgi:hypothetical protein